MLVTDIQQPGLEIEAPVSIKWLYPERSLKALSSFSMMSSKVNQ